MMSDVFMEYLIKRRKDSKDILLIILLVLAAFIVSFGAFFAGLALVPSFSSIWFLLFATIWYFTYIFVSHRNVEFEYILTNSEFDIDKIAAKRKRTRLVSFDFKKAEIVANINDNEHNSIFKNNTGKVLDFTSNTDKENVYFVIVTVEGERQVILFEPTERMLENIYKFNPRNVFIQK